MQYTTTITYNTLQQVHTIQYNKLIQYNTTSIYITIQQVTRFQSDIKQDTIITLFLSAPKFIQDKLPTVYTLLDSLIYLLKSLDIYSYIESSGKTHSFFK